MKTDLILEYSEQQLVDCDTNDSGCNGGWPSRAWSFLKEQGGSQTTGAYPYKAVVSQN